MDTGAAGAKAAVASLGGGANAINIATTEDLGGGLRGGTNFQMRFNAANGDVNSHGTGNALFHEANVFVSGGFGTVRMGKIAEASNCTFDAWGCTGGAGFGAGVGTSTLIGAAAQANSVSYATRTINGFSAGFQSSVTSRAEERTAMNIAYAKGPIAAQFLQTKSSVNTAANGTTHTTALLATNPITDVKGQGTSIAASYNFGVAKLNVVNAKTENAAGAVTADITGVNASMPMGAYTLLAGYAKDKKALATADTKVSVGVSYALSKRTTLGADLFKAEGQTAVAPATGTSGTGFVIRARHTF